MKKLLFLLSFLVTSAHASFLVPFFDLGYQVDFLLGLPDVKNFLSKENGKEQLTSALLISLALKKNSPIHMQNITEALARITGNHVASYAIKELHLETAFNGFVADEKEYWEKQVMLHYQIPTIKIVLEDARLKDEIFLKFFYKQAQDKEAVKIMTEKIGQAALEVVEMVFKKLDEMKAI